MPSGVPVATVAINGGLNAGLLAVQILAVGDEKAGKNPTIENCRVSASISSGKYDIGGLTGLTREQVCVKYTDLSAVVKEKYDARHSISLLNMSVLCECKPLMQHRAYADVETMRKILIELAHTDDADMRSRFSAYDVYADLREMYNKMKNVITIAKDYDIDVDELLDTAKKGHEFPVFDEAYNDTYNKRTFGWL